MLKQNNQKSFKQQKLHEAVLKHKVRNLRAKVQTLLPIHLCEKISKRNNRLKKHLARKKNIQIEQCRHGYSANTKNRVQAPWKLSSSTDKNSNLDKTMCEQRQSHLDSKKSSFYGRRCTCGNNEQLFIDDEFSGLEANVVMEKGQQKQIDLKGYHFQKLTDEEIQQIQEDKLYYLGQQRHIKAYQQFIRQKYAPKITKPISNQVYKSVSKSTIAFGTYKNIFIKEITNTSLESQSNFKHAFNFTKNKWLRNNSVRGVQLQGKINSSTVSRGTIRQDRSFRHTANEKLFTWNVNENLARINEEEQVKRILLSMQLKSKQQRVEQNYNKIKNTKQLQIQKENLKNHIKILTAQQKKRKIYNQVGEIVELTQQLRKKCIQRKTYKQKQNQQFLQDIIFQSTLS